MEEGDTGQSSFIDESSENVPASRSGIFALALAVLAAALSLFALWLSFNNDTGEELDAATRPLEARLEELSTQLEDLRNEVTAAEAARRQNANQMEALRKQMEGGFGNLSDVIRDNQSKIQRLAASLENQAEAITALQSPRQARTGTNAATGSSSATASSSDSTGEAASNGDDAQGAFYTVQRGDTMGAIARKFDIPLDSLLDANPGVNPRALQIGQRIRIP